MSPSSLLGLSTLWLLTTTSLSHLELVRLGPNEQAAFLAVASNQLSVPTSNLAIGSTSTMGVGRRRLLQINSTAGVNVNISIQAHPLVGHRCASALSFIAELTSN